MRLGLRGLAPECTGRRLVTGIIGSGRLVGRHPFPVSVGTTSPQEELLSSVFSALTGLGLRVLRPYRNSRNDHRPHAAGPR